MSAKEPIIPQTSFACYAQQRVYCYLKDTRSHSFYSGDAVTAADSISNPGLILHVAVIRGKIKAFLCPDWKAHLADTYVDFDW